MKTNDRIRMRIEKAVLYIEDNLSINLRASDIARHAHLSPFHFQRLFSAYLGEPVSQYILSRRLERAARSLSASNAINILELALDSGFDTHSSFSKAFKKKFTVSPSTFRDSPALAKKGVDTGRPFLIASPGSKQIESVENVDLQQFEFQYRKSHGTLSGSFFQLSDQDVSSQFVHLLKLNTDRCHQTISCFPQSPQGLNENSIPIWFGGSFTSRSSNPWSKNWYTFSAGKWAVFEHWGDYGFLYQTWNQIYRGWLSQSNFTLREEMPFEAYVRGPDINGAARQLTRIHIPIS